MKFFTITQNCPTSQARNGIIHTAHGDVLTPCFMPVGTQATVKLMHPAELEKLQAQIILANTYHLHLRPGEDLIAQLGGVHRFANWKGAMLSDSGGFQVFSLAKLRKISNAGVSFQSHIDGKKIFLSPEIALQIQAKLGTDIAMLFDECPPHSSPRSYVAESLELTTSWAKRSQVWLSQYANATADFPLLPNQAHFAIVQGGVFADLREKSARELAAMDFSGYAIGGLAVGESEAEMMAALANSIPHLPKAKPRYAMGLGEPLQLMQMIAQGVDMFDCVMPTRLARHGMAFTRDGLLNIKNQKFASDENPLSVEKELPDFCRGFSRAYIRHLFKANEMLGARILTYNNLFFLLDLMKNLRDCIADGNFEAYCEDWRQRYLANIYRG